MDHCLINIAYIYLIAHQPWNPPSGLRYLNHKRKRVRHPPLEERRLGSGNDGAPALHEEPQNSAHHAEPRSRSLFAVFLRDVIPVGCLKSNMGSPWTLCTAFIKPHVSYSSVNSISLRGRQIGVFRM